MITPDRQVRTTCPYCGVGCQMTLNVKDEFIYSVEAPFDAAPNYGMLCVKGRFGTDYVKHPGRVKTPLIRANREEGRSAPPIWREATWDEALDLVADELSRIVTDHGGDAIATYASAKATNEDNYVFQKVVRALLGTNNVDHCARLCHAGSVTGLQLSIGSSAMSNSIAEMENLEAFIVTGTNTTETHPVIANFLKRAVRKNGAKLIVIDPRQIDMTDFATLWLRQNPGTDVAVFQAMAHVIVEEELYDRDFIAERTEGFNDYLESLETFTPEWAEQVSGVPAEIDPRGGPHLRQRQPRRHLLGHGHQPEHPRHRQHPLAGQPGPDVRPRRQVRHRPQPAARPEQRPGLLRQRRPAQRLHRLPERRRRRGATQIRSMTGARRSTPPPA